MTELIGIKIKVCCISSLEEARIAISMGADAIGLVGAMPNGPGVIPDEKIAAISSALPPDQKTFLLTSETSVEKIVEHHRRTLTTTIQLTDRLEKGSLPKLRAALPGIELVQVVHVLDDSSLAEALAAAPFVDTILLDSGNPDSKIKKLGGTGQTHNWQLSKKIVEQAPIPVYLAGGLNAANVQEAIRTVFPFGVDLCSGVRTNGELDELKLHDFFRAVRSFSQ